MSTRPFVQQGEAQKPYVAGYVQRGLPLAGSTAWTVPPPAALPMEPT